MRRNYIEGLGHHSYGSWVRGKLKHRSGKVLLIGSGQLSESVLPWIDSLWGVCGRNESKVQKLLNSQKLKHSATYVGWYDTTRWLEAEHLIFCVPGSAFKEKRWTSLFNTWQDLHPKGLVIDFGMPPCFQAETLSLSLKNVLRLSDAFLNFETHRKQLAKKISCIKHICDRETLNFAHGWKWILPHGWQDLCA